MKIILSFVLSFFFHQVLLGQWQSTHGPYGGFINDLEKNSLYLFAATPNGIYRSGDAGLTWVNLPFVPGKKLACLEFFCQDNILIGDAVDVSHETRSRHLFRSVDHGIHWEEINRPSINTYFEIGISASSIILADRETIWISIDDGNSWSQSSINEFISSPFCLTSYNFYSYIGTNNKIFRSSKLTDTWIEIPIPGLQYADQIYVDDSLIFVRDYYNGTLFRSIDGGSTWINLNSINWGNSETQFARIDSTYYVSRGETIYRSTNLGETWKNNFTTGMNLVRLMIAIDTTLIAGCYWRGIYRSDDLGKSVHFSSKGLDAAHVTALTIRGNELITGAVYQGVFAYNIVQDQWYDSYFDELFSSKIEDIEVFKGSIYSLSDRQVVSKYDEALQQWIKKSEEWSLGKASDLFVNYDALFSGGNRFFNDSNLRIHKSNSSGWPDYIIYINGERYDPNVIAFSDQYYFVSDGKSVARSDDRGHTWNLTTGTFDLGEGGYPRVVNLFTIGESLFMVNFNLDFHHSHLLKSDDKGNSWTLSDEGIPISTEEDSGIKNLIQIGDYLLATTYGYKDGLFITPMENIHWTSFNEGLPYISINMLKTDGEYIYAATEGHGVWKRKTEEILATTTNTPSSEDLLLFPNPAQKSITLTFPYKNATGGKITISDIGGKYYVSQNIQLSENESIDISNIPPGIYFVAITCQEKFYTTKLIIQEK